MIKLIWKKKKKFAKSLGLDKEKIWHIQIKKDLKFGQIKNLLSLIMEIIYEVIGLSKLNCLNKDMYDIIKINKAKEIDAYIKRETEDKMFAQL